MTLDQLDDRMSARFILLSNKYPQMCAEYLAEMHEALDWAEEQLEEINQK